MRSRPKRKGVMLLSPTDNVVVATSLGAPRAYCRQEGCIANHDTPQGHKISQSGPFQQGAPNR